MLPLPLYGCYNRGLSALHWWRLWGEILLTLANINYYVLVTGFCWIRVGGTRASAVAVVSRRRWRTLFTVGVGCLVGSTRLYSEQNVIEKSNGRITLPLDWASHTRFASTFPKKETFTAPTIWLGTHWCWRWHLTDPQSLDRRQFIADRRPLCVKTLVVTFPLKTIYNRSPLNMLSSILILWFYWYSSIHLLHTSFHRIYYKLIHISVSCGICLLVVCGPLMGFWKKGWWGIAVKYQEQQYEWSQFSGTEEKSHLPHLFIIC